MEKNDILIVMGDFSAREGFRERMNYRVMGTYGLGQRNDRGERLLDLCYVCTNPTQNSSWPNHQDVGYGNLLTNAHPAKLTTFWSAGNLYLASKTVNHFLVLT